MKHSQMLRKHGYSTTKSLNCSGYPVKTITSNLSGTKNCKGRKNVMNNNSPPENSISPETSDTSQNVRKEIICARCVDDILFEMDEMLYDSYSDQFDLLYLKEWQQEK
jgi:hypothetical protein